MVQEESIATKLPRINEIVWLLEKFDPDTLNALRNQYPEATGLLTKGIQMGGTSSQPASAMKVLVAAALKGLTSGVKICEQSIPEIRRRLKRANALRFASEVLTVLAGASIFTVLAMDFGNIVRYIVAFFALLGSLVALAASFVGGTFHSSGGSLFDYYKELIDCQIDAKRILQELEIWKRSDLTDPSIDAAIKQSNEICSRILKTANLAA